MGKRVLISGASIAGLSLAYWLHRYGYEVSIVEISSGLRRGGSPIDVRGDALEVVKEMGILEKIREAKYVHTDEIVNAKNESLVTFSINDQAEYLGDIEIHRDDLVDILYENIPIHDVEFLFENRIEEIIQHSNHVEVTFKKGESRNFDFVFGADGTHSGVRKLVFGDEGRYSRFFGAYFAFVEAPDIKPDSRNAGAIMYQEPGKLAALYPFNNTVNACLVFRSLRLSYDFRNDVQHKQILKDNFQGCLWRIPEILNTMLNSGNLYFDEVCQIHMPGWTKGRVALVGDAAHTAGFPTGMGTSLAIQGATLLANELNTNDDYNLAFAKYNESFKPYVEGVQVRIVRGLDWLVPETEEGIEEAIRRFKK